MLGRNYTILSMCSALPGAISSVVVSNTGVLSSYTMYNHPSSMREVILLMRYMKKEQDNDGWKLVFHMETAAQHLDYC
jgi:hypothetical protein